MRDRVLEELINAEDKFNYLAALPLEILLRIANLLDVKSFIVLGVTSNTLYQPIFSHGHYWINQLIKAGCNKNALSELKNLDITLQKSDADAVFNYKLLYQHFLLHLIK